MIKKSSISKIKILFKFRVIINSKNNELQKNNTKSLYNMDKFYNLLYIWIFLTSTKTRFKWLNRCMLL